MSIQKDRLLGLIEFAQQSARLRGKPASNVDSHGQFALYEHELQGLPGVTINANSPNGEDEIWLAVARLHETRPPDVTSAMLRPWVKLTQAPTEEPQLRDILDGASLIEAGTHCSPSEGAQDGRPVIDPQTKITFPEYDKASLVTAEFATYVSTKWRPWANEEKLRRKTMRLYAQLFTLKHEFEGSIVETSLELAWGVGLGIWNCNGTTVNYPVISQLVELSLNPETAEVEIRPRDVEPRLEIDWYSSVDNLGVGNLEKAAKDFFGNAVTTFSPFDRGTFEPLLRTAVTSLDANGIYWPSVVSAEDRTTPKPDDKLKVTDTWVLFARPRTNNLFLQDLENLKKQAAELGSYPPAVAAVVTDPETDNPVVELPSYRGVSASYHSEQRDSGNKAQDLFFPKPFNDEQVRIIQLLDCADGVVAQGPPGTGKTHTIANVICHYLAQGKRVLVTSMKDPALAVLQEQLPEEIRPLAISLLTSEQDGMKQFEHAIYKIASKVQGLNRPNTKRAISHLEDTIDALHGKLAGIDRRITEWAKQNLAKIGIDGEEIEPQDAAQDVVQNAGQFEWIPDSLGISPEFAPKFSNNEVVQLREARRALGQDIDYLDMSLPQLIEFPDSKNLLEVHQDLSQLQKLTEAIENGDVPVIANSSAEMIARAEKLLTDIETFQRLHDTVVRANRPWIAMLRARLRTTGVANPLTMLQVLGVELEKAIDWRRSFLERPVFAPEGVELDPEIRKAVRNLAAGKSAFGPIGWVGKSAHKARLANIRILASPPAGAADWKHVDDYLELLMRLRELSLRWNTLVRELQLEATVPDNHPEGGLAAAAEYALCKTVNTLMNLEQDIFTAAFHVLPTWNPDREVLDAAIHVAELEKILRHHISKHRLANVWVAKERFHKVLDGRKGRIIDDIRRFISEDLGNPEVEDARLQSEWSALMAELSRVLGLGIHLTAVRRVCEKIESSGAPQYATLLKQPLEGTVDALLPDNWRTAWRLRRLSTYLASIDAQHELKRLGKERHEVESDLSRAYRDIVVKRTWLKLAENASPSIRSALQAYLVAIQKIGKGTGKRAVRYRQDARLAAAQANPAVPCWIMPHYRVSESLPPKLGCFDLVVIDEASQSDLSAMPALLRARKVLVVGDDKQVSPEGVGLEEEKVRSLMIRFLGNQVETYRPQMSPERSIYDLYKVVFAKSAVMLKEHFRCVAPIIEYSKREFYNHELRPLRLPKASQRLDPPLIDVLVRDGYRKGDLNLPEARFIVDEINAIVSDPRMAKRSIGVVSLLGDKQALEIWERLTDEIGPELMQRHRIACGDARTFQGKERDIMFLSMVSAPNDRGAPLSRDAFAQRFNVAASRARDRMYLVRSVELEELSTADKLRRSLIQHFATPFAQDEARVEDLRQLCESQFERELYDELTQRGYRVTPQVRIGQYRIDLVVEGHNDARLAVECDGDKYHGPDKWADDMQRQRVLERAGWIFWRCFASAFIRRRRDVLDDLVKTLTELGIEPIGAEGAPISIHTERRLVSSESGYDNSKPADGNGQSVLTGASPEPFDSAEQKSLLLGALASPRAANTANLQGQDQLIGVPVTSGALGKNQNYSLPLGNEPPRTPRTNNSPITERSNREYGQKPSANRRLAENRSITNRVIEGLAALEDQFRNPHCSQCGGVAHIRVYTAGPVVVCTNSKCNKIDQIDLQKLQRLVENLRLACRNCKRASLLSTKGPLGNFLRCQNCGENTSWQFVAGYSKNNYQ